MGEPRRTLDMVRLRRRLKTEVMNRALSGPRADSMAVDGFLPLLATRGQSDLFALWFAWPVGDMPQPLSLDAQTGGNRWKGAG